MTEQHPTPSTTLPASPAVDPADITGVLLAGGQSRRMFAGPGNAETGRSASSRGDTARDAHPRDKGLLDLAGRPMLAHVAARLGPQVGRLVINANGDPARFAPFGLPVVADSISGFVGPLAGVLAGMRWSLANAPAARFIATVSTDAPFLPASLVARLAAPVLRGEGVIALASSGGELHPVIGLWPVALADDLEGALHSGVRKVLRWTDTHATSVVEFLPETIAGQSVDPFFNANTPEELAEARALLGA